jgi:hypothetical protein
MKFFLYLHISTVIVNCAQILKIESFFTFLKTFLTPLFEFVKFSLDAKIFVKNDILCDLITMHKCHVFLTIVEKIIFSSWL